MSQITSKVSTVYNPPGGIFAKYSWSPAGQHSTVEVGNEYAMTVTRLSRRGHSHGSCHALVQPCGDPRARTVVVQPVQLHPLAARVDQAQDAGHVGRAALEPGGRAGAVRANQPRRREGQQRQAAKQHPPGTEQADTALPSLKQPPLE